MSIVLRRSGTGTSVVDGPLQTKDYVRAIQGVTIPGVTDEQVSVRVAARPVRTQWSSLPAVGRGFMSRRDAQRKIHMRKKASNPQCQD